MKFTNTKQTVQFAIILLIVFAKTTLAQENEYVPFPTKNAEWSSYFENPFLSSEENKSCHIIALFDEDTTINGLLSHKVFGLTDSVTCKENAFHLGYIQTIGDSIYYFDDSRYGIIYIYNLQVGDTVPFEVLGGGGFIVTKIDTVLLGNKHRKRYLFDWSTYLNDLAWIEGVGSTNGLLFPGSYIVGMTSKLLCFKQDGETIYYNDTLNSCYPFYKPLSNKIDDLCIFNVYPNPANDFVEIALPKKMSGNILIVSSEGKTIIAIPITQNKNHYLNIDTMEPGIYLVLFTDSKSSEQYQQKLIIN